MVPSKIDRFFISTNSFPIANPSTGDRRELPLISTLPDDIQVSISRYLRLQDRQMSLASALLKYHFIHRTARIPWSEIVISRTPYPHRRPYWDPSTAPSSRQAGGNPIELEFNVSHQGGLIGLAGCILPESPESSSTSERRVLLTNGQSLTDPPTTNVRLGIDITCTNEPNRGPNPPITTTAQLNTWIEIFTHAFSPAEIYHMKYAPLNPPAPAGATEQEMLQLKLRRFYTFFALKEAYVKMTGEALLADWLREVEFRQVRLPAQGEGDGLWGSSIEKGTEVYLNGERLRGVENEMRGLGQGFIVAITATGGGEEEMLSGREDTGWTILDWRRDVEACALGTCRCLSS